MQTMGPRCMQRRIFISSALSFTVSRSHTSREIYICINNPFSFSSRFFPSPFYDSAHIKDVSIIIPSAREFGLLFTETGSIGDHSFGRVESPREGVSVGSAGRKKNTTGKPGEWIHGP